MRSPLTRSMVSNFSSRPAESLSVTKVRSRSISAAPMAGASRIEAQHPGDLESSQARRRSGIRRELLSTFSMSVIGTKRTLRSCAPMSVFGGKADIVRWRKSTYDPKQTLLRKRAGLPSPGAGEIATKFARKIKSVPHSGAARNAVGQHDDAQQSERRNAAHLHAPFVD